MPNDVRSRNRRDSNEIGPCHRVLASEYISAAQPCEGNTICAHSFQQNFSRLFKSFHSFRSIGFATLRTSIPSVNFTALKNELVELGIPPSSANDAVNAVWKEWDKKDAPEGRSIYALVLPSNDKWTVELCSRKASGGPIYKLGKSTGSKSIVEVDLPQQASALIPISDIFDRVSSTLAELLG
jgi:hypothetical protein